MISSVPNFGHVHRAQFVANLMRQQLALTATKKLTPAN